MIMARHDEIYILTDFRGAIIFAAQLLGGIVAAAIIDALTPGPLNVANSLGRESSSSKSK